MQRIKRVYRLDFLKKCAAVLVIVVAVSFIIDTRCNLEAEESIINFGGVIVKTIGEVKIRKSGEKTWVDAKHGMELGVEDQIQQDLLPEVLVEHKPCAVEKSAPSSKRNKRIFSYMVTQAFFVKANSCLIQTNNTQAILYKYNFLL